MGLERIGMAGETFVRNLRPVQSHSAGMADRPFRLTHDNPHAENILG